MNARSTTGISPTLLRVVGWGLVAAALTAPLVAMRFTDEVNWTPFDFLAAGALLVGAGLLLELAAWKLRKPVHFVLAAVSVTLAVAVTWAQGAVGIF